MTNNYLEESIDVADKFIKTICFIDDQPFFSQSEDPVNDDIDHRINADIVTKTFAKKGKSCSFLKYDNLDDEPIVLTLAKNCDVTVLDWRIIMPEIAVEITEDSKSDGETADEDLEEDVEGVESRGRYALRLLENILQENHKTPKLVIIYTAEYDTEKIFIPIKEKLDELKIIYEENSEQLSFHNDKIRISIYFKLPKDSKHLSEEVKNKRVDFSNLPEIINSEFAQLTQSLVIQTAIRAISEVRNNTFNLLESYNKNLDAAFLTHRSLLPNPEDAEEQLLEIIGSDIKSLVKESEISSNIKNRALPFYLKDNYSGASYVFEVENKDLMPNLAPPETIDAETLHSIVLNGVEKTFHKKDVPFQENILFSKVCHKNLTHTFVGDKEKANLSDIKFSILTTIKPRYQLSHFYLSLGTILKEDKKEIYWVCVQPKCDSVRISQKKRAFLLLKLNAVEAGNKFHFAIKVGEDYKFFKINYKIYDSRLVEFYTDASENVSSIEENNQIKFKKGDNNFLIWVGEMKNDFAQNISNTLSYELSRVGLDLSEWLRRWSGN